MPIQFGIAGLACITFYSSIGDNFDFKDTGVEDA
jgi:hypothetical protein